MSTEGEEATRFPPNLEHADLIVRIVQFRWEARASGLPELAARFVDAENLPPARLAVCVVGALAWLEDKSELRALTKRLEVVALNLRNLKSGP